MFIILQNYLFIDMFFIIINIYHLFYCSFILITFSWHFSYLDL